MDASAQESAAPIELLPPELHNMIFEYAMLFDRPVITSKPRVNKYAKTKQDEYLSITSRLELALSSDVLRERLLAFLNKWVPKQANKIWVNLVNYDFSAFTRYYDGLMDDDSIYATAMKRFHFAAGVDTRAMSEAHAELVGKSYLAANIIFTSRFPSRNGLKKWLDYGTELEKKIGHLRMMYKVAHIEDSVVLDKMLEQQKFELNNESGQKKFILAALQSKFGRPTGFPKDEYIYMRDMNHRWIDWGEHDPIPLREKNDANTDEDEYEEVEEEDGYDAQGQGPGWRGADGGEYPRIKTATGEGNAVVWQTGYMWW